VKGKSIVEQKDAKDAKKNAKFKEIQVNLAGNALRLTHLSHEHTAIAFAQLEVENH
jgi:hypothetical protein